MYDYVSKSDFVERFRSSNVYRNNFTMEGLEALYDCIEADEAETGVPMEFDMVAFACEFAEYESEDEFYAECGEFDEILVRFNNGRVLARNI